VRSLVRYSYFLAFIDLVTNEALCIHYLEKLAGYHCGLFCYFVVVNF
jgi:hypothetical protein